MGEIDLKTRALDAANAAFRKADSKRLIAVDRLAEMEARPIAA